MADGNMPLAADPYTHQADAEWKIERLRDDRRILSRVLGLTEEQTYERSKAFVGREPALFHFVFAMRFLARVQDVELTESATVLRICALIFVVEGITPGKPTERLPRFLVRYLTRDDKLALLSGFTFTPEYDLGANRVPDRHLMFEAAVADHAFRHERGHDQVSAFCSTNRYPTCFCREWLLEQPDEVLCEFASELGSRLYEMRCAVVHDATPVIFGEAREDKPAEVAQWSVSLVDAFSRGPGKFVTYESGILVPDLSAIIMRGVRECFEDGAKF